MKRIIKFITVGAVALLAIGGLSRAAVAGGVVTEITLPTTATGIGSTDSLQLCKLFGEFPLPATESKFGYMLSVYFRDTVAAAAAADTLLFRLVRKPNEAFRYDSTILANVSDNPAGWITVYSFALVGAQAVNFPIFKHIPLDSMAVYPIGAGIYSWQVCGSRVTAAHVPDKAYKFSAIIEHKGGY